MRLWVTTTDNDWFRFLRAQPGQGEVNFWHPGKKGEFRVLAPGELVLFKLHTPHYLVGGGFFLQFTRSSYTLAWHSFGQRNGVATLDEMRNLVEKYHRGPVRPDYPIGGIVLGEPFFWDESQWIPAPADFSPNIVHGKTYNASSAVAIALWEKVRARLQLSHTDLIDPIQSSISGLLGPDSLPLRPGSPEHSQVIVDLSVTNERLLAFVRREPELLWKLTPRGFEEIVAECSQGKAMRFN